MRLPPNVIELTPSHSIADEDASETADLKAMFREASDYLLDHKWCEKISEAYMGIGVARVVAVFLFRIVPVGEADEWVWVIVGDLPPAYIATDHAPNAACALDAYIGEMELWVRAANEGGMVEELIPVNVPPTKANAKALQSRLNFLREHLLARLSNQLEPPDSA
jgi:hypothetical protein